MKLPPNSYNPSLCRHAGRLWATVRGHDRGDWRTSLYLAKLDDLLRPVSVAKIAMPERYEQNSHEDARLWSFQDQLYMSWTISQFPAVEFRCVVAYAPLVMAGESVAAGRHFIPQYGQNDFSGMEKNFCPFVHDGKLWFYYKTDEKEGVNIFIQVDGDRVSKTVKGKMPAWAHGPVHGGAMFAGDKNRILFFNSRTGSLAVNTHRYHIGCVELSNNPPFDSLRISTRPILSGEEGYCLDGHKFFKSNVMFTCGAVAQDGKILLAHGRNDHQARIAKLDEEHLNL